MHYFHKGCLFEWLRIRASCPTCRLPLRRPAQATAGQGPEAGAVQEASGQGQGTGEQEGRRQELEAGAVQETSGQGQGTGEQEGGAAHAQLMRQEAWGRGQVAGGEVQDAGCTVRFGREGLQGMEQRDSAVSEVDQDAPADAAAQQQQQQQQQQGRELLQQPEVQPGELQDMQQGQV